MDHSAFLSRAGDQVAPRGEVQAVGAARRLQEGGEFTLRAPFHDAITRLVGEEEVAPRITGRPLGELEAAGQLLHRSTARNHAVPGAGAAGGHATTQCPHDRTRRAVHCPVARLRSWRAKYRYAPTLSPLITIATTFHMTTGREAINRP